ncbi:TM2 domain-containing protein [Pseudomonas gingeri]|uniref:TM2 domain-containing protein n=1 Tax=Pseudomonas gingeri TaxID=117681 RepID=A0A7Y7XEF2_9PSED|nr:TM2 domain-containing protein [Pseudomonas gingeri]NWA26921.1 TM2 domain-containing protein [Pseudomonas gingeri]NWB98016.1 TM2 domain-containing protein [Pseudomonas gingeri]NWD70733.1 TM2 domain-containing protein [Pseudomonas gingeri]NWD72869.1 TM2 domain-containing protein [Pseudomonas gingeri]
MKGKILNYDTNTRNGIISGDDGNRYTFDVVEWKAAVLPKAGARVDFANNGAFAEAIFADGAAASGNSKKIPAALLAFFFGCFGVHKFYLGYKSQGVIMLLIFLFGWLLAGIPSIIISIIAFVEFIIYLIKSEDDFEQTYVVGQRGWF